MMQLLRCSAARKAQEASCMTVCAPRRERRAYQNCMAVSCRMPRCCISYATSSVSQSTFCVHSTAGHAAVHAVMLGGAVAPAAPCRACECRPRARPAGSRPPPSHYSRLLRLNGCSAVAMTQGTDLFPTPDAGLCLVSGGSSAGSCKEDDTVSRAGFSCRIWMLQRTMSEPFAE